MQGNADIDFAYKYPFSDEAKSVIDKLQITKVEQKYLNASRSHIEAAIEDGINYKSTSMHDAKVDYLITYAYSKMLLSAVRNVQLINRYAIAEAKRSEQALAESEPGEITRLAKELGINVKTENAGKNSTTNGTELKIRLDDFLRYAPKIKGLELVNQRLKDGAVFLNRNKALRLLEEAMRGEMAKGLPMSVNLLPKEITEFSKTVRFSVKAYAEPVRYRRAYTWIDKLLETPIHDIRHRSVNLIFAPYLVNTKGMDVEQATKIINEYIEKCKQLDSSTRINERYIRYQCEYAKRRGLRPLSLARAKELLNGTIDINTLVSETG